MTSDINLWWFVITFILLLPFNPIKPFEWKVILYYIHIKLKKNFFFWVPERERKVGLKLMHTTWHIPFKVVICQVESIQDPKVIHYPFCTVWTRNALHFALQFLVYQGCARFQEFSSMQTIKRCLFHSTMQNPKYSFAHLGWICTPI